MFLALNNPKMNNGSVLAGDSSKVLLNEKEIWNITLFLPMAISCESKEGVNDVMDANT